MLHFGKIPKNLVKFGEKSAKFWQILRIFGKKTAKISAIFNENFEIRERCKGVHCVDLGESFPTSIYLQKSASIQPRTSLVKFARSPRTDPPGLSGCNADHMWQNVHHMCSFAQGNCAAGRPGGFFVECTGPRDAAYVRMDSCGMSGIAKE